jgi:hypothetical protein
MNAEQHTSELVDQGSAEERQAPPMNSGPDEKSAQPDPTRLTKPEVIGDFGL